MTSNLLTCNTPIDQAAHVVAIVGLLLSPIWSWFSLQQWLFFQPEHPSVAWTLAGANLAVTFTAYSALWVALLLRRATCLMILFLIFNAYSITVRMAYCLFVGMALVSEDRWHELEHWIGDEGSTALNAMLIFGLAANSMKLVLNLWFECIGFLAYRHFAMLQSLNDITSADIGEVAEPYQEIC